MDDPMVGRIYTKENGAVVWIEFRNVYLEGEVATPLGSFIKRAQ